ncbi:hypothetical protein B0A50_07568 [Salinomyces thailandicus]|uniref:Uncharacterized protein n=1 Tax=Salinomyces thailandicus TaxID=706561 RepID=A0A4U0TN06_9PEZI|nr:hypothetical protein B0A50_07568 [Salinomyces thailandica]
MAEDDNKNRPASAVRSTDRQHPNSTTNVSLGLMRPLYTSCSEHHHAGQHQQHQHSQNPPSQAAPRFLRLNELPRMPTSSPVNHRPSPTDSPFLRLPTEIRLQIYALLVLPRKPTDLLPSYEKVHSSTQDYYDYDQKHPTTHQPLTANLTHPTLLIRTIDPIRYIKRYPHLRPTPLRTKYSVRCDRFRSACKSTTYRCVNNPRIEDQLAILRANKQIHAEAAELLYSSYTFDFDTHVEAIIPFFSDLTPFARSCVKSLRFVKRALAYEKEFDRCEWSAALRYLTSSQSGIALKRLQLGIVAGRPGEKGWDRVARYTAQDFQLLRSLGGMEWMQYLLEIQNLQELDVQAVVEHCPPATNSTAMAEYIRFSASVETGFRDFLHGAMVMAVAA